MSEMKTVNLNGVTYEVHDPDALSGVDATLSKEGKPADAAAVGAAVSRLSADKAPAGYGLGTTAKKLSNTKLDSVLSNGWYCFDSGSGIENAPQDFPSMLFVENFYNTGWCKQTITLVGNEKTKIVRSRHKGTWGEWEYENPLMELGKEYRTTERWQGKAVYTILANIGALPNSANANATINCTGAKSVIRDTMTLQEIASGRTFTGDPTLTYYCGVNASGTAYCNMKSGSNLSAYNGIVQLWYTRD